jgi:hypothetical protein
LSSSELIALRSRLRALTQALGDDSAVAVANAA